MKKTVKRVMMSIALLSFGLALAGPAQAEEDIVERTLEACKTDIESFCSQVTPGEGRLLACFVAHEDKISGRCSWALYQAMDDLETFVNAIAYVAQSCRDDLLEHCADVEMGKGRVTTCLLEHQDMVSPECDQAIQDVELGVVEE